MEQILPYEPRLLRVHLIIDFWRVNVNVVIAGQRLELRLWQRNVWKINWWAERLEMPKTEWMNGWWSWSLHKIRTLFLTRNGYHNDIAMKVHAFVPHSKEKIKLISETKDHGQLFCATGGRGHNPNDHIQMYRDKNRTIRESACTLEHATRHGHIDTNVTATRSTSMRFVFRIFWHSCRFSWMCLHSPSARATFTQTDTQPKNPEHKTYARAWCSYL